MSGGGGEQRRRHHSDYRVDLTAADDDSGTVMTDFSFRKENALNVSSNIFSGAGKPK